jgi:hypothetical protein
MYRTALRPNVVVQGWWPRRRYLPAAGGAVSVELDGNAVALLSGFHPREWAGALGPGPHLLRLIDLSGPPRVFEIKLYGSHSLSYVPFRGRYRKHLVGAFEQSACWVVDHRPRRTLGVPSPTGVAVPVGESAPGKRLDR